MHPRRCVATTAALSIAAVAALALLAAPAAAQTPADLSPAGASTTAKAKKRSAPPPTRVAANRPPARVTVRRRSYLDPGTETRTHEEHFMDYAFPPGDHTITADPNNPFINWTRMPFPSCYDLPGFCRP
jgi:hypothetical protein